LCSRKSYTFRESLLYWELLTVKKLLVLAAAVLSAAFVVSAALSVAFLTGLDQVWAARPAAQQGGRVVSLVLPSDRDPFWENLVLALRRTSSAALVDYEVTRYSATALGARETIERLSFSRVDAVICYPPDGSDLVAVIDAAEGRGVPILLLENDLPNSRRRVFFGTSSFQWGHLTGQVIRDRAPEYRRVGVLVSQLSRERQSVRSSLFLNGLSDSLSRNGREFVLADVISPPGRFAGEELVWGLLRREPPIDVLVTTNAKDTSSALQAVVEANRVGRVRLVGVGEDPAFRAALSQGLLTGLVLREPDEWAQRLSQTLTDLFAARSVSSYVNLPVHALTAAGELHDQ